MSAETRRQAQNRNNMEKNGLRVRLSRLDGEREETLFDIKRKEKSILTKRRSFRIRRENCKKADLGETRHAGETTIETIERGTSHSVRHLQGSLRRSRTESCLPCIPPLPSYNERMQSLQLKPPDHCQVETPVSDGDNETDHDHRGGNKTSPWECMKQNNTKHSLDLDLTKRVSSNEKMDYLVRNVFERLYHGTRSLKKAPEPHLDEDFDSLRSCRYLRLPKLK